MGRWNAVSDWDYDDEQQGYTSRTRSPRCRECGEVMAVVYNGDDQPVFCRCEHCRPQPAQRRTA